MVAEDNGEPEPKEEKPDNDDGPDQLFTGELLMAQVSLAALKGFTHLKSVKLMGDIQGTSCDTN